VHAERAANNAKGGRNSANSTKAKREAVAIRNAAQEETAVSMGVHALTHWGRKISDGSTKEGKRVRARYRCLVVVNGVQCPWEGDRQKLRKHLTAAVNRTKGGMPKGQIAGHGLTII
jgi:hypothetical protein